MNYSDIQNPKIKTIIDNLKHQSHTVMCDLQDALDKSTSEDDFIELAIAEMDNLHTEIFELTNQIRQAGEE